MYRTKGFDIKLESVDYKKREVEVYFAAFDIKDSDGDIIKKGAFKKTIQERGPESVKPRIAHLRDHDPLRPIGKIRILEEDGYGLKAVSKLGSHQDGMDALHLYADGIWDEHSIGYEIIKSQEKQEYTELQELRLWEGSALIWGANMWTPFVAMKNNEATLEKTVQKIERINKALRKGTFSDETFVLLQIALKNIESDFKTYKNSLQNDQPRKTTDSVIEVEQIQKLFNLETHSDGRKNHRSS